MGKPAFCMCENKCAADPHLYFAIYSTQNLIRIKLIVLFAEGPAYLTPNIDKYVEQLSLYKHDNIC